MTRKEEGGSTIGAFPTREIDSETIQEPWPSNLQSATTFDASAEVSTRKIIRKIFFPHIDGRISRIDVYVYF